MQKCIWMYTDDFLWNWLQDIHVGFFSNMTVCSIVDAWLSNITYYVYSLPNAAEYLNKDSADYKEFETNFCNDVSKIFRARQEIIILVLVNIGLKRGQRSRDFICLSIYQQSRDFTCLSIYQQSRDFIWLSIYQQRRGFISVCLQTV